MQKCESCLHEWTLLHGNLFGGYATPTKCEAFWRLALNSYVIFSIFHIASKSFLESFTDEITSCQFIVLIAFMYSWETSRLGIDAVFTRTLSPASIQTTASFKPSIFIWIYIFSASYVSVWLDHKNFYTVLDIPLARIKSHKNSRPSSRN